MPCAPDQAQDQSCRERLPAFKHAGQREAPPTEFFSKRTRICRQRRDQSIVKVSPVRNAALSSPKQAGNLTRNQLKHGVADQNDQIPMNACAPRNQTRQQLPQSRGAVEDGSQRERCGGGYIDGNVEQRIRSCGFVCEGPGQHARCKQAYRADAPRDSENQGKVN